MSETTKDGPSDPVNAPVRPRWIWSGVALSLGGLVVIGAGLVLRSWPAAGGGVTLIVVGLGLSWAGGVLWDATSGISPADEVRAVRDGAVRPGVKPGTQVKPSAARAEARRASRVTRVTHEPKASTSRSTALRWAPVAGWMLLLTAAVLLVSQWELVGHTATGRRSSYRDTVAIIVFGLSGVRLAFTPGRHRITSAVAGLTGGGLVIASVLAAHDHVALAAVEAATGTTAIFSALVVLATGSSSSSAPRNRG